MNHLGNSQTRPNQAYSFFSNLFYTYSLSFLSGLSYRNFINIIDSFCKADFGLVKDGIPCDELATPVVTYLVLSGADRVFRRVGLANDRSFLRKYTPHLATFALCFVAWEAAEYLTPITEMLNSYTPINFDPSFLGSIKDLIMISIILLGYNPVPDQRE